MNITEFATVIGADLQATYNTTLGYWQASFRRAETKEGAILTSAWGSGPTANVAIEDYARQLRGKLLVLNAWSEADRKEFRVPLTLDCPFCAKPPAISTDEYSTIIECLNPDCLGPSHTEECQHDEDTEYQARAIARWNTRPGASVEADPSPPGLRPSGAHQGQGAADNQGDPGWREDVLRIALHRIAGAFPESITANIARKALKDIGRPYTPVPPEAAAQAAQQDVPGQSAPTPPPRSTT
jgi:hypothetical protein